MAIFLVASIGGLVLYAFTKPDSNDVTREAIINAPPEAIFPLVNDFRAWKDWSPYEGRDPNMTRTYEGPKSGKGATYSWRGTKEVGSGRMEILESTPSSKISIKLDFMEPFEGHNTTDFLFIPTGDATKVTWHMYGPGNFMTRMMHCVFDMDKMIGTDFETGLSNMKKIAEKNSSSPQPSSNTDSPAPEK